MLLYKPPAETLTSLPTYCWSTFVSDNLTASAALIFSSTSFNKSFSAFFFSPIILLIKKLSPLASLIASEVILLISVLIDAACFSISSTLPTNL